MTRDRDSANAELSAVLQYLDELNEMCVAKAETHGERDSRRAVEIAGWNEVDDSFPEFVPAELQPSASRQRAPPLKDF